ncbi:uncharacterized protein LOC125436116 [Sphaerodactylus townsendi]|uniref:Uncharacterized protein n=1 Tax=Sphaerodactylus townsendi TaxID=933632 RepID=A0ACB8ESZ1_9SAUR|nr:uncharacterized protein LOC125436116 [Sphaerodactylus townsendi]XP_048358710.1 uncharacterized protein LOC125436116 [Sphaerodactylus townsendi]XP_048358711.1 uncharacterized protein LOC125436116 [Sphaerodactylus townsendi]
MFPLNERKLAAALKREGQLIWSEWGPDRKPGEGRATIDPAEPGTLHLWTHKSEYAPEMQPRDAAMAFARGKLDGPTTAEECAHAGPFENGPRGTTTEMATEPRLSTGSTCQEATHAYELKRKNTTILEDDPCTSYNKDLEPVEPGAKRSRIDTGEFLDHSSIPKISEVQRITDDLIRAGVKACPNGGLADRDTWIAKTDIDSDLFSLARTSQIAPDGSGYVYAMLACRPPMRPSLNFEIWKSRDNFPTSLKTKAVWIDTVLGTRNVAISANTLPIRIPCPSATRQFRHGDPAGLYLVEGESCLVLNRLITPQRTNWQT